MSKRRTAKHAIPFLVGQPLADGRTAWHWKPSPRLRTAGFVNVKLGNDERAARLAATDLNHQVADWQQAKNKAADVAAAAGPAPRLPRLIRFGELLQRYRQHADFTDLRAKTRLNYETRLRQLDHWALDGQLPVRDVTPERVNELRAELMKGSRFRAASLLAVLRLLLAFAEREGIIPKGSNPAAAIRIPQPPARKVFMRTRARDAIIDVARKQGEGDVAFAVLLGFWSIQRQGDLLALNRMAWRELADPEADPRHLAVLANPRGRVMGFRLQQSKTGAWVDVPVPPELHDDIEARFRTSDWLFPHFLDATRALSGFLLQRRFRAVQSDATRLARLRGDELLAAEIEACQFRDLRRTGMTFYGAHTKIDNVTALSGHGVLGKKTILDVYMPGNTAGAIACVAAGVLAWRREQKRLASEAV